MMLKQGSQANAQSIQSAFAFVKAAQLGTAEKHKNESVDEQGNNSRPDTPMWRESDEPNNVMTPSNLRVRTRLMVTLPNTNKTPGIKTVAQEKKFLDEMRYLVP